MLLMVLCETAFGLFMARQEKVPPKERSEILDEIHMKYTCILTYQGLAQKCKH